VHAGDDRLDAFALWGLCPDALTGLKLQRSLLLNVRSPSEAAQLLDTVPLEPELEGLARLIAGRLGPPAAPPLPKPQELLAVPLDEAMLSAVAAAREVADDPDAAPDENTRAHAILALAYLESLEGLGLETETSLPPLGRRLALLTLDHGRQFCLAYIQRRVSGLAPIFARVELALLDLRVRLARGPAVDDPGLAAAVIPAVDRYLDLDAVRTRLADRTAERRGGPRLEDLPSAEVRAHADIELHNLRAAGRHARAAIEDADADPMQSAARLAAAVRDAGLERHAPRFLAALDRWSAREVKRRAAEQARREAQAKAEAEQAKEDGADASSTPPPPAEPAPAEVDTRPTWDSAGDVALEVERALTDPRAHGFAKRWVHLRAERRLVERPDALIELLDRADEVPQLTPLLPRLVAHLEAEHLRAARALDVLHALAPSDDEERRRRADFAARTRTDPPPR